MPMYWDAYLADTTHLTCEENGAYLLLLAAMWRRDGSIPNDDKDNARITRLTIGKWRKAKARLGDLLIIDENSITQKNLQKIWKNTQEKIAKNVQNGAKGGRPKSKENKDLAKANGFNSLNPNETIPEPEPEPYKPKGFKKGSVVGEIMFDARDQLANSEVEYIFDQKKWFSENEILFLEETHPNIDIRAKLEDDSFRKWAFTEDPQLPKNPANNFFAKQGRVATAHDSLMDKYAKGKTMTFGDLSHLTAALDAKGKHH